MCLLSGSVRVPSQYHSAKCAEVVHVFWPLRIQPGLAVAFAALGLESHRRRVGARVGLAVPDRELHVVAEDLRQELLLHLLARLFDQRLADDADALADLRAAARRELFVQEVLVHARALRAAVFLRPGQAQPAPLAEARHEGAALGRVDDLRHVLAGQVEHVGIVVRVEVLDDLLFEGALFGREIEVHAPDCTRATPARRPVRK